MGVGGWEDAYSVEALSLLGARSPQGLVTGGDGCMVLGFAWQEGVMTKELMKKIIEEVRMSIDRIVDNERAR